MRSRYPVQNPLKSSSFIYTGFQRVVIRDLLDLSILNSYSWNGHFTQLANHEA